MTKYHQNQNLLPSSGNNFTGDNDDDDKDTLAPTPHDKTTAHDNTNNQVKNMEAKDGHSTIDLIKDTKDNMVQTSNKVQKEEETNATVHVLKDTCYYDDDDKDTPPPTPHDKTMILQYPFCFNGKMTNINNIETYMTENLLNMFPLDNDGENCNIIVSYDDTRTGGDDLNINEDTINRLGEMRKSNAAVNKWLNDELVNLWMKW